MTSSWVAKTPRVLPPCLPVSFAPHFGSATVRVKTASIRVVKVSIPSRKKGRFSGKNRANRSLTSSWATSASTWEKSGLTVPLRVRFGVMPQRTERPASNSSSPLRSEPSGNESSRSVRFAVRVGVTTRLRPRSRSVKPVILATWHRRQLMSRSRRVLAIR